MLNFTFGRFVLAWLVRFRGRHLLLLLVQCIWLVLPRFWRRIRRQGWRRWLVDGSQNIGLFVGVGI